MADAAFWVIHLVVALVGFGLSAISPRATVTVFFVLLVELFGLVGMALPGASNLFFSLELFGGLGLLFGVPISLGRTDLAWWFLPALAAGSFIVLRAMSLFGEDGRGVLVGGLQTLVAALSLAAGMLAGRGVVTLVRSRIRRR